MEYKGYRITPLGTFSLVHIQPRVSGDIPEALKGHFTTKTEAQQAINRYLDSLTKRGGRKNGKEASTPSSK